MFTLPEEISGSYWITDYANGKKMNLIYIEATQSGWNIISNQDVFLDWNMEI